MMTLIDFPDMDFGPCCACGNVGPAVRNFILLDRKAPVAGTGWGCFQCGLPLDGAVAVICDACLQLPVDRIKFVIKGQANSKERVPVEGLDETHFGHDMAKHPEVELNDLDFGAFAERN